jgi:hypothetical protein
MRALPGQETLPSFERYSEMTYGTRPARTSATARTTGL